jgi:hypothetical protein
LTHRKEITACSTAAIARASRDNQECSWDRRWEGSPPIEIKSCLRLRNHGPYRRLSRYDLEHRWHSSSRSCLPLFAPFRGAECSKSSRSRTRVREALSRQPSRQVQALSSR